MFPPVVRWRSLRRLLVVAKTYQASIDDSDRLQQIVTDVAEAHRNGANVLVLTTWANHLTAIVDRLTDAGIGDIIDLRGGMAARQRQSLHFIPSE